MVIFILSIVVQLALVVHVIKTGRNIAWVFILLFFPLIGTLAYFIVEIMPELSQSMTARRARRGFGKMLNPDRDFKQAASRLAVTTTVDNAMALADACLKKGDYAQAAELYAGAMKGLYADDPQLLLGCAEAHYGLGDYRQTRELLERLREKNPDFKSESGHLLYAKALEGLKDIDAAIDEYEALSGYYPGPEPACRLGRLYAQRGDRDAARQQFEAIVAKAEIAGSHYNKMHREWIRLAKGELDR